MVTSCATRVRRRARRVKLAPHDSIRALLVRILAQLALTRKAAQQDFAIATGQREGAPAPEREARILLNGVGETC